MAVSVAVSTQYTNVTDTEPPGKPDTTRQQEPRLAACSRAAKNHLTALACSADVLIHEYWRTY